LKRIYEAAICGYYGFGNLGDELLADVIVSLYRKNGIGSDRLTILSANPESSSAFLKIPSTNRWNPVEVWRTLRQSKTLILGGGGLFQDSTSVKSCLYYWGIIRMASAAGCIPWMFGQSVGPFGKRISEFLAEDAVGKCKIKVVRDSRSMDVLKNWGCSASLIPDPVLALRVPDSRPGGKYLLVNIRPWGDGTLPEKVLSCALKISSNFNIPIRIVAMAPEDENLAKELTSKKSLDHVGICRINTLKDVLGVWEDAAFAFGMRLHFCVLSFLSGLPCMGIPYDPKVEQFCRSHSLLLWNMFDLPEIDVLRKKPSRNKLEEERAIIMESFNGSFEEVRTFYDRT